MLSSIMRHIPVAVTAAALAATVALSPTDAAIAHPNQDQKFFDFLGQKEIPPVAAYREARAPTELASLTQPIRTGEINPTKPLPVPAQPPPPVPQEVQPAPEQPPPPTRRIQPAPKQAPPPPQEPPPPAEAPHEGPPEAGPPAPAPEAPGGGTGSGGPGAPGGDTGGGSAPAPETPVEPAPPGHIRLAP